MEQLLVVGIKKVNVGSDLNEDALGLLDEILVDNVIVGGAKVDTNGVVEDEDGNEAVDNGDLDVVESLLDLAVIGKHVVVVALRVVGWQAHASATLTMEPNESPTPMISSGGVPKLSHPTRLELQRSPLVVLTKVVKV